MFSETLEHQGWVSIANDQTWNHASMISLGWGFLACNALAMDGEYLGANGDMCITGAFQKT